MESSASQLRHAGSESNAALRLNESVLLGRVKEFRDFSPYSPRSYARAKKMQREGVFREMKRRKAYEKPSERKTREMAEAIRRVRKAARKQAQRDGLIPMPKRREDVRRSVARPDLLRA